MLLRRSVGLCARLFSNDQIAEGEKRIAEMLKKHFPKATDIAVEDTSGGCGTFYRISIISPEFKGKPLLEQHKMVNQALGDEVQKLHGVNIQTSSKK